MEVLDDDILLRRVKTAERVDPRHWSQGRPTAFAFGLASARPRRRDADGLKVPGRAGKYEKGYSVNVQRLSSVAQTLGASPGDYVVIGFRVGELRAAGGYTILPDPVTEGHPSYRGQGTENLAHAIVIGPEGFELYELRGKERLAQFAHAVDQETGELLSKFCDAPR